MRRIDTVNHTFECQGWLNGAARACTRIVLARIEALKAELLAALRDRGSPLLDELREGAHAAGRTYRHQWRAGDAIMWDNRAVMHRGRPWPYDEERTLASLCVSAGEADGLEAVRP